MKVITYEIELLEPVLVTSLQGDPNSAVTFDYLPGSVLRGMIISRYLRSRSADASDDMFKHLFLDGSTRYLNGYPLDIGDVPAMPVPLSWQRVKNEKDGLIFDFAIEVREDEQQWQPVSEPFCTPVKGRGRLIRPEHNVAVHTQRTARFGRAVQEPPAEDVQAGEMPDKALGPDEIRGAVYRYDALAAGQKFQAAIICDNDADEALLRGLIGGQVILGGARSGGYGRVEIRLLTDEVAEQWETEDDEDGAEDKLIVTLQSDVLLRDEHGQFAVDPEMVRQVLNRHLHVELGAPERAFLGTQVVAGFNRKWRLPLPQALAIRMGSVLVFQDPGCDVNLLESLEARGIGERRAEGFGRIVFNRQRAKRFSCDENKPDRERADDFTIDEPEAQKLAEFMVGRMLRKQLDEALLAKANAVKIGNPPSNAQLSRLRSVVLEELRQETPGTDRLRQFIEGIQERGGARRQFERSLYDGRKPLLDWLKDLLKLKGDRWTIDNHYWRKDLLGLKEREGRARIGNVEAEIHDTMRLEYVLRLIDLVLAKAAKQRRKEY